MKKFFKTIQKKITEFHFIDFLGISLFFIILVITAAFFLRRSDFTYVTIQVSNNKDSFHNFWFYKPPNWYVENLKIDTTDNDLLSRENLRIVDVYYYPVANTSEQAVFVTLKIRAVFNKHTQQYSYQGQPLLIGEHRIFKLGSVVIPGFISKLGDSVQAQKTKKVIVRGVVETEDNEDIENNGETRFVGIKNYLAQKLIPGTEIKDSKGRVITKILEAEKKPGYREFIYANSLTKVVDPERTKVKLVLEMTLQEINGFSLYREEERVALGEKLLLSFEDFVLYFRVEAIENLE